MTLVTVGLIVVGLVQLVCLLALIDQYKGLLQIRTALSLVDTPYDLGLVDGEVSRASAAGLPTVFDAEDLVVIAIFSTKCASCITVAQDWRGRVSEPTWALIAAGSEDQAREFQSKVGLPSDRVLVDVDGRIASNLKIRTFPSAVVFSKGELKTATTIPSYRQLRALIQDSVAQFAGINGRGGHHNGS
jgi:hypothetical protein